MSLATKGHRARMAAGFAGVALLALVSTASAFPMRAPQIAFASTTLQAYLNGNDGGINVLTDQLNAQLFSTSISGNTDFTLMVKLTANATQNSIGVYNALDLNNPPTLYQLFPAAASAGWYVSCHFATSGSLTVTLFDANGIQQGSTDYSGVDRAHFSFYLQNTGGTYYSQDSRNGGKAQVLTYAGTDINYGDWWECFQDTAYNQSTSTFTGAVLLLQSVVPTPVHGTTWGHLKSTYR